jgi:outer membrane protein OmpA-like peptidoglycan-associated protein
MDAVGHPAPNGRYEAILRVYNAESYMASQDIRQVEVRTDRFHLGMTAVTKAFSPGSLKAKNRVSMQVSTDAGPRILRWEFSVVDAETQGLVYVNRGVGRPPRQMVWRGRTTKGNVAPEATYLCGLTADLKGGDTLKSDAVTVAVDRTAPTLSFGTNQPLVDFAGGSATFRVDASDANGIAAWKVSIQDESGNPYRTDKGSGAPSSRWIWDGAGDRGGESVQPGDYFTLRMEVVDDAGNLTGSEPVALQAKSAATVSDAKQMSLNLTTVYFEEGSSTLDEESLKNLRGAIESIRPYVDKSLLVVKGSVSPDEKGDATKLSHERAAAVRDFLAQGLKLEARRIQALGVGTQEPLVTSEGAASVVHQRRAWVTLTTTP